MKKLIIVFIVGFFVFTSCQKDDELLNIGETPEVQDEEGEWNEDGESDGDGDDDNHDHAGEVEEGAISLYKINGQSITLIKDYEVSGELKSYQDDKQKHQEIWDFVTKLIPIEYRDKITEFELFHGGGQLLGYVIPVGNQDLSQWKFALAIDQANGISEIDFGNDFTYTTLHELGHVVTLNDDQVKADQESCSTYHTGEGCSTQNSYINTTFNIGWKDIIDEAKEADSYDIYEKYKSRFLTEYAATNPGEDIAEVFTYFIIQKDIPTGNTIAEQKVKALYKYPELVQMREDIRGAIPPTRLNTLTLEGYKAVLPKLMKGHDHH